MKFSLAPLFLVVLLMLVKVSQVGANNKFNKKSLEDSNMINSHQVNYFRDVDQDPEYDTQDSRTDEDLSTDARYYQRLDEKLTKEFHKNDLDQDGFFDMDDLQHAFAEAAVEELFDFMRVCDKDKDGLLSLEEYLNCTRPLAAAGRVRTIDYEEEGLRCKKF